MGTGTDPVAILALIVAVLAAGFTGWQAVTAHLERSSRWRARLELVGAPLSGGDKGVRWTVHNLGEGTAAHVELEAVVIGVESIPKFTFKGRLTEPLHGKGSAPVVAAEREWPAPLNRYVGYPDIRVWEGAIVKARWVDGSGKARFETIAVRLPDDPPEKPR